MPTVADTANIYTRSKTISILNCLFLPVSMSLTFLLPSMVNKRIKYKLYVEISCGKAIYD